MALRCQMWLSVHAVVFKGNDRAEEMGWRCGVDLSVCAGRRA